MVAKKSVFIELHSRRHDRFFVTGITNLLHRFLKSGEDASATLPGCRPMFGKTVLTRQFGDAVLTAWANAKSAIVELFCPKNENEFDGGPPRGGSACPRTAGNTVRCLLVRDQVTGNGKSRTMHTNDVTVTSFDVPDTDGMGATNAPVGAYGVRHRHVHPTVNAWPSISRGQTKGGLVVGAWRAVAYEVDIAVTAFSALASIWLGGGNGPRPVPTANLATA